MPNRKSEILITNSPLPQPGHEWQVSAGAVVDFWGVVRALEDGREISGIEYETHEVMARHQMELLVDCARVDFPLEEIILRHRVGFVAAGEASLFLRVTSGHRTAAFEGSQWMISELKKKVPIWKRPLFVRPGTAPAPNETRTSPIPASR
jgi:molybdopterin synthase catalytic subunit